MNGNNGGNQVKEKANIWGPTEKFKTWADLRLNPDHPMGMLEACKEASTVPSNIYRMLKKPEYIDYLNRRREEMFKVHAPAVDSALIRKCLKGDVSAIRLFHELYGDLNQPSSGGTVQFVLPQEMSRVFN